MTEFKDTITAQLRAAVNTTTTLPLQVFAQDESRIGLHTIRRRRITARGVKPVGVIQQDYANCWVYGCVAPLSGDRFFLLLPALNAEQMQLFLDAFATAHADTFNVLVLDNSGAHTAKRLRVPSNVALVFQPAASPELNPTERVWEDLKAQLAWLTFDQFSALQDELVTRLTAYDAATIQSLTGYPYLLDAIRVVCAERASSMTDI